MRFKGIACDLSVSFALFGLLACGLGWMWAIIWIIDGAIAGDYWKLLLFPVWAYGMVPLVMGLFVLPDWIAEWCGCDGRYDY